MWADQERSEDMWTPRYLTQVTFPIVAADEPIESAGGTKAKAGPFPAD